MLRTATSRLQPFGAWMPDFIVLRLMHLSSAEQHRRAASCYMHTLGALVLVVTCFCAVCRQWSPMHSTLVQGMRSTDTQEKEVKNGRLAMVSRPRVLTVLTIPAGTSRTTVCSIWPAAAEVHLRLHALQFWEGLQ